MYDAAPEGDCIPGLEFAGVIEAVGDRKGKPWAKVERTPDGLGYQVVEREDREGTTERGLRVGDRVMGFTRFGAYATHINIGSSFVRPIPQGWSYSQGAAFLVQALTAWYGMFELGKATEGKRVLVHSAAGGVGLFTLQICQMFKLVPIAIVGSSSKADLLIEQFGLNPKNIIVRARSQRKFGKSLDAALEYVKSKGFDIIMDSVAGKYFRPGYERLARGGRHVLFGAATYTPRGDRGKSWTSLEFWISIVPKWLSRPKLDVQQMIGENKGVLGFNLIWLWDGVNEPEKLVNYIEDMLKPSVRWRPPLVGMEFDFFECPDALRYFKSGDSVGKVVLKVSHPEDFRD